MNFGKRTDFPAQQKRKQLARLKSEYRALRDQITNPYIRLSVDTLRRAACIRAVLQQGGVHA